LLHGSRIGSRNANDIEALRAGGFNERRFYL
jgi:hypothetical protein